jgi:hypothetical protein
MGLLTANDIEDEDDDENEHDRRIEEGRDQSFDAASGRLRVSCYRWVSDFAVRSNFWLRRRCSVPWGTGQILMRIGKGRAEHQELAKADGFTGANGDRSNIRLFGKGFAEPSTENKLSSPDRSALGFYLTCLQSSLSRLFDLSPTHPCFSRSSLS